MLTRDGAEHARHRDAVRRPFRLAAVRERFAPFVDGGDGRADRRVRAPTGAPSCGASSPARSRRASSRAARARGGRDGRDARLVRRDRRSRSRGVAAGGRADAGAGAEAFEQLARRGRAARSARAGDLRPDEAVSNAAVMMFGGIETTEGMIANLVFTCSRPAAAASSRRAAERRRGVAAPGARGRGHRPLRDARRRARRRRDRAAATSSTISLAGANRDPAYVRRSGPLRLAPGERAAPHRVRARPARVRRDAPRAARGADGGAPAVRAAARPAPRPGAADRAARARVPQAAGAGRRLVILGLGHVDLVCRDVERRSRSIAPYSISASPRIFRGRARASRSTTCASLRTARGSSASGKPL